MTLVQVTAPHFCAGIVIQKGVVVHAAPILSWSIGKGKEELKNYFVRKGWKTSVVDK